MTWQLYNGYIEQGAGGILNLENALGVGIRWNNLRSDGTSGWESEDPAQAAALQTAFGSLAYEKSAALERLRTVAMEVMQGGHTTALGPVVPTDAFSLQWLRACNDIAASNASASFNLADQAGVFHTLNATQMQSVWSGVVSFMKAALDNWQTLAAQINAATDWKALPAFNMTTGWPT